MLFAQGQKQCGRSLPLLQQLILTTQLSAHHVHCPQTAAAHRLAKIQCLTHVDTAGTVLH